MIAPLPAEAPDQYAKLWKQADRRKRLQLLDAALGYELLGKGHTLNQFWRKVLSRAVADMKQ